MVHWLIEIFAESEMGEKRREVVYGEIEVSSFIVGLLMMIIWIELKCKRETPKRYGKVVS